MSTEIALEDFVIEALRALGGEARIVQIAKHIWDNLEGELRSSGDLFYTWQYMMRWSGKRLVDKGVIEKNASRRVWILK